MKRKLCTLLVVMLTVGVYANAQTTKKQHSKGQAKRKTATAKTQTAVNSKSEAAVKQPSAVNNTDSYYTNALGLKFLYGISVTGKHFLNNNSAIEAIVRYRNYSFVGSAFNLSAMYEYHGDIDGVQGLRWYAGGGAYLGYFSYDNGILEDNSSFTAGVTGVLGLEYKIKNFPLAISADWQPVVLFNGDSGFSAENGGVGVKYTF